MLAGDVALELGYHDQAHLIRDFREQIGDTPAAYARRCVERNEKAPQEAKPRLEPSLARVT